MNYTSVKNPQWADAERKQINCIVNFELIGEVPFAASRLDVHEHGRQIFSDIVSGMYGEIAECIPPDDTPANLAPTPVGTLVLGVPSLQFFERFTDDEQLAIVTATMTMPDVKLWYDKLMAGRTVSLSEPRLAAALDNLVAKGIVTPARALEVLPADVRSAGMATL